MTFEPAEATIPYSKTWATTAVQFDEVGKLVFATETETVYLTEFDDYFIHMLNDHLPTINMYPDGDGLDRLREFRELYIQILLDAKHEYVKDSYSPP